MKRKSLFLILFILQNFLLFSQDKSLYEFKRVSISDIGVEFLTRQTWDKEGNLWGITEKGLVKYNGYSSEFFAHNPKNDNSLLSNEVILFEKVNDDEFWITYVDTFALSKFNPSTQNFTHYFADSSKENSLPYFQITKVFKDSKNRIWLPTWGDGLFKLNEETGACKKYKFPIESDSVERSSFVKDIDELADGRFLISFFSEANGRRSWPVYFNPDNETYEQLDVESLIPSSLNYQRRTRFIISMMIVHFAYEDIYQNIWFGTYSGLIHFDTKTNTLSRITAKGENLETVNLENTRNYTLHHNKLWIGTPNRGVMIVDVKTKEVRFVGRESNGTKGLVDNRSLTIAVDPMDNVWISTRSGDLNVFVPFIQKFQLHEWNDMGLSFFNRSEQSIPLGQMTVRSNGKILLSHGGGLKVYNPQKFAVEEEIIKITPHENGVYLDNFKDLDGEIHLGINYGPGIYDKKSKIVKYIPFQFRTYKVLFRHSKDFDRAIFYQGNRNHTELYEVKKGEDTLTLLNHFNTGFGLTPQYAYVLESGNWLLSVSYGRFIIYNPKTTDYNLYSPSQKKHYFPDSTILVAYKDFDNSILFGTKKGLYRFSEKTGKIEFLNAEAELGEKKEIHAIRRDKKGKLWLASKNSLIKWDKKRKQTIVYGKEFGIEVGGFLSSVGQMDSLGILYFATQNGVLIFNPKYVKLPNHELILTLSTIAVNDSIQKDSINELVSKGEYKFDWDQNFIIFKFHTNQVFSITPHQFKYRLIGLDDKWILNGSSNTIRFSNLVHGNYQLEVRATNSFGVESDVLLIPFTIKTPYWLATWFYILIGVILIVSVVFYIKNREKTLKKQKEVLEAVVKKRTKEAVDEKNSANKLRSKAEEQKQILEQKQQEITDSINYAKRIQEAILPSDKAVDLHIPNSFVMYLPKDIVAGDFYWMHPFIKGNSSEKVLFAAADCTGHGVPGAMVSVVCNNALNRAVREFSIFEPGKLLDKTREIVIEQFEKGHHLAVESNTTIKDGMDISLCYLDKKNKKLLWSGANNPLWIVRNKELIELKGDRQPVGKHDPIKSFTTHSVDLMEGDVLYVFSDGYADQFGGDKGKKFKTSSLRNLILSISEKEITDQKEILFDTFNQWKGEYEQLDDVCFIGVRL